MSIVEEIKGKIKDLEDKLVSIQTECSHPKQAVKERLEGSSGNYDPSADGYTVYYHCTLCDKRWNSETK